MSTKDRPRFPLTLLAFWFWRLLPWWSLIAAMIFLMQIAISGIIHDNENVKSMLRFLDLMPKIMKSTLGGEGLQAGNLPALIAIGYNHPFVLSLYMIYAVATPTGMLAGEVQSGTMELILSRSVTKTQVYLCAAIVTVTGMIALVAVMFMGTVVATGIYDFGEPVPLYKFFRIAINGGLLAGTIGAISLLAAASFHKRTKAVGVAVAYIVIDYFVAIISGSWPKMAFLEPWTLFHYVNSNKVFAQNVWPLYEMMVLSIILLTAAIAGAIIWNKRDLRL